MSAALRAAYVRVRQADAGSAYDFVSQGARSAEALLSNNPAMGLVAQAMRAGIELQPAAEKGKRGSVGLSLARQGCADAPRAAEPVTPIAKGNRVEYARDGITEWYVNGPLGIEQGFTVARDLGCQHALMFEMQIEKSVVAELKGAGTLVAMNAGGHRYHYGELYAYDAAGKELPSSMELEGQRLRLIVKAEGARYPVVVDPRMYVEQAKLTSSDGTIIDTFGVSVSISGDTAIIGASNRNTSRGQAYAFVRSGLKWSEQAKLNSSDGAALDNFGSSVALDGNTAVIGAPYKSSQQGEAYVFLRTGAKWAQQAKLLASDGAAGDMFGNSVSISGDTLIVGTSSPTRNAAYVYLRTGTMWALQQKLTPSDSAKGDRFGVSVALNADTAVVGASDKGVGSNPTQGQAYVYLRTGTMWNEEAKLTASDGAAGDRFGYGVALSGDTALVGAYKKNNGQGGAYVYLRSNAAWSEQAKLTASDGAAQDQFGTAVAVGGDTAVVGANQATVDGNVLQGAAYVYTRSNTTWSEYIKLTASNGDKQDAFGSAVSSSPSGNTVLVGAYLKNIGQNLAQGQVFVYGLEPQPEGSACLNGSDCVTGSCQSGMCAAASVSTDMGTLPDGDQLAIIGGGFSNGAGCSLAAGHSASGSVSGGLFGALSCLLALGLLRRRNRECE